MPYVNTSFDDCSSVDDQVLDRHCSSASGKHNKGLSKHLVSADLIGVRISPILLRYIL